MKRSVAAVARPHRAAAARAPRLQRAHDRGADRDDRPALGARARDRRRGRRRGISKRSRPCVLARIVGLHRPEGARPDVQRDARDLVPARAQRVQQRRREVQPGGRRRDRARAARRRPSGSARDRRRAGAASPRRSRARPRCTAAAGPRRSPPARQQRRRPGPSRAHQRAPRLAPLERSSPSRRRRRRWRRERRPSATEVPRASASQSLAESGVRLAPVDATRSASAETRPLRRSASARAAGPGSTRVSLRTSSARGGRCARRSRKSHVLARPAAAIHHQQARVVARLGRGGRDALGRQEA